MDQATAPAPARDKGKFKKGEPKTKGRLKGSPNKVPKLLKDCIMMAAELEGFDQQGRGKLVGFLRKLAREDIRSFAMLLGRVVPLQYESRHDMQVEVTYRSVEEVQREMASRGISMDLVQRLMHQPATVLDHEDIEMVDDDEG